MDFHSILHTLITNWKKIFSVTFLTTLFLLLIFLFIYPHTYRATAVLLPPEKSSSLLGLSNILFQQNMTSLLTPSLSNASSQLYAEILRSRSVSLYVIEKLKIQDQYDENNLIEAANKLSKDVNIELTKEGLLKVSVDYTSKFLPLFTDDLKYRKEFSAKLTNTFVEALDKINNQKIASRSKKARMFLENQIKQTKAVLDSVELKLQEFQKKNKTISLPDQLKASIENAAKLKAEISQTEIELGLLKYNVQSDDKIYQSVQKKLEQLKEQYKKIESENQDFLLNFSLIPQLGRELGELYRELKIQNEVYSFLQQQYYKEKIEENRDLPTVEVLDPAVPPNRPVSPRILFYSFLGGLFAFLFTSAISIFKADKFKIKKSM
ncbi:MAG: Wzz/FepE/Etk N-terminal domain-containing protein [Ignavibacterium sp.]|nr:Wzz/FepE/Etk N-terminal domain-containing protein [Ignavibacterium sp.]MCX7611298.1 Wzz/FepE/Etk N-terminal domain-containing protein [Ignavibacterium sp.]MDW8375650.1 Wzz/FepE/Etk N-terminal domain-containing protein [Ignavibacteriales bacterium]